MVSLLLLFILETLTIKDIVYMIVAVVGALWLWKSGLPQQLWTSSNELLKLRTIERDDAIKKREELQRKVEELEKEVLVFRREVTQRIEINLQDQAELEELRIKIKKYEQDSDSRR